MPVAAVAGNGRRKASPRGKHIPPTTPPCGRSFGSPYRKLLSCVNNGAVFLGGDRLPVAVSSDRCGRPRRRALSCPLARHQGHPDGRDGHAHQSRRPQRLPEERPGNKGGAGRDKEEEAGEPGGGPPTDQDIH